MIWSSMYSFSWYVTQNVVSCMMYKRHATDDLEMPQDLAWANMFRFGLIMVPTAVLLDHCCVDKRSSITDCVPPKGPHKTTLKGKKKKSEGAGIFSWVIAQERSERISRSKLRTAVLRDESRHGARTEADYLYISTVCCGLCQTFQVASRSWPSR